MVLGLALGVSLLLAVLVSLVPSLVLELFVGSLSLLGGLWCLGWVVDGVPCLCLGSTGPLLTWPLGLGLLVVWFPFDGLCVSSLRGSLVLSNLITLVCSCLAGVFVGPSLVLLGLSLVSLGWGPYFLAGFLLLLGLPVFGWVLLGFGVSPVCGIFTHYLYSSGETN